MVKSPWLNESKNTETMNISDYWPMGTQFTEAKKVKACLGVHTL
jgi:hypothetical protein